MLDVALSLQPRGDFSPGLRSGAIVGYLVIVRRQANSIEWATPSPMGWSFALLHDKARGGFTRSRMDNLPLLSAGSPASFWCPIGYDTRLFLLRALHAMWIQLG
jgi:hypothetical protein